MIKTLIIEDDLKVLKFLQKIFTNYFSEIEIVGVSTNIDNSIRKIKSKKPDLVILDIDLSESYGFNILNSFKDQTFNIVLISSPDNNIVNTIKLETLDIIQKPLTKKAFDIMFNKYYYPNQNEKKIIVRRKKIKEIVFSFHKNPTKIIIKSKDDSFVILPADIICCKSKCYYTILFLNNGDQILVSKTLKELESLLKDFDFVRGHNSNLVNINYIKSFRRKGGGLIIMKDGSEVPVSRRKKSVIMNVLFGEKINF